MMKLQRAVEDVVAEHGGAPVPPMPRSMALEVEAIMQPAFRKHRFTVEQRQRFRRLGALMYVAVRNGVPMSVLCDALGIDPARLGEYGGR